jgi:hypothetical protein
MDKTPRDRHKTGQRTGERPRGARAMPKTLAEKHGYKGVEYSVRPTRSSGLELPKSADA